MSNVHPMMRAAALRAVTGRSNGRVFPWDELVLQELVPQRVDHEQLAVVVDPVTGEVTEVIRYDPPAPRPVCDCQGCTRPYEMVVHPPKDSSTPERTALLCAECFLLAFPEGVAATAGARRWQA